MQMCYSKYHNVDKFSLEKVAYVDKWIILTISAFDTLQPLGI